MKDPFEEKWNTAVKRARERLSRDKSLRDLERRYRKLLKRLNTVRAEIDRRRNQIFREELKKHCQRRLLNEFRRHLKTS